MPIVISHNLVLSPSGALSADHPVIGWQNLVTTTNIEATTEDPDFPATNLANPATHLKWVGDVNTGDDYITITTNSVEDIDYLAVARHNFGSANIVTSVEGTLDADSPFDSPAFAELVQEVQLADDSPVLYRFDPQPLGAVRLRMQDGDELPTAAVIYVGKLLILPRRIWQGHTPIKYGRKRKVVNGMSESGNFLGRVVLNETRESTASLSLIDPDTYRADIEPFIDSSLENPFFFAWRPGTYPREVGYAWLTADPRPVNAGQHGLTEIDLQMQGIV